MVTFVYMTVVCCVTVILISVTTALLLKSVAAGFVVATCFAMLYTVIMLFAYAKARKEEDVRQAEGR